MSIDSHSKKIVQKMSCESFNMRDKIFMNFEPKLRTEKISFVLVYC